MKISLIHKKLSVTLSLALTLGFGLLTIAPASALAHPASASVLLLQQGDEGQETHG
jgi:hypothetical protein